MKTGFRLALTIASVVVGTAWATLVVRAADVKVIPGDSVVKIRGRIGDDSTFVGTVGLTANAAVPALTFRASDLLSLDGRTRIRRQQVVLAGSGAIALAESMPTDVEIKITGVRMPGTYKGLLYFLQPKQGLEHALAVPIEVTAEATPTLTPRRGSEALTLQLVACTSGIGCSLGRALEPAAFLAAYPLAFENDSADPFDMKLTLSAIGALTHGSVERAVSVAGAMNVPATRVLSVPVAVNSRLLPADHYVGDLQLRTDSGTLLARVPLEVNVRSGPMPAVLTLLAGVLLGQLVSWMKAQGRPQSDALLEWHRVAAIIDTSPEDSALLSGMMQEVRSRIYAMRVKEATDELTAIEKRWRGLVTLREIERALEPRSADAAVVAILDEVRRARTLIATRQDEDAAKMLLHIQEEVKQLAKSAAQSTRQTLAAREAARVQARLALETGTAAKDLIRRSPGRGIRLLNAIAGLSAGTTAELTLWVVRPLLYFLLVAALVIVGMLQLYVKNPTFGAAPVSDYFGLLVWAMSSDVASRTLANVRG